jgi:hypothetical protein
MYHVSRATYALGMQLQYFTIFPLFSSPINSDEHEAEERDGRVGVKKNREELAEKAGLASDPVPS